MIIGSYILVIEYVVIVYIPIADSHYIQGFEDSWDTLVAGMECLKLQVIFRNKATNYRALVRKMTRKEPTFEIVLS